VGWLLLTVLLTILFVDLAIRAFYVRLILPQFETRPPFNVEPHPACPRTETVSTTTDDGLTLRGRLYRCQDLHPRGLILFFPELDGNHCSAPFYCAGPLDAGFDVLSFDFRNQGDSDAEPGYHPIHWPTRGELRDAAAILRFVAARDELRDLPLGLMGISRGSLVALIAAAEHPQVRAVCGEGTYTVNSLLEHFTLRWARVYVPAWAVPLIPLWHYRVTLRMVRWVSEWKRGVRYARAERKLPQLRDRPVLLIAGARDNYVQPEVVRGIAAQIGPHCQVWEVPEAKHNQARETAPDEYDRQVVEFFAAVVPAAAEPAPAWAS
jgi:pimeloyl-ACP methyl ester carboxylesterase